MQQPSRYDQVVPLRHEDLRSLRLQRHFRFDSVEVGSMLDTNPGASFWIPETDELILTGNWRHRKELMAIHALVGTTGETALIEHARDHAREHGALALLLVDMSETRRPPFYAKHGFRIIDRIATYELNETAALARQQRIVPGLSFARIMPGDAVGARQVLHLDHLAFPWFWWNVAGELDTYLNLPDVEVWIGLIGQQVVSYIGFTHFGTWGHLDRIATHPDHQRGGIGTASLNFAIDQMRADGAQRIALSTQGLNTPAQRMYQRRGFFRTPQHDYTVHGIVLDQRIESEHIDLAQTMVPPFNYRGERTH